MLGKTIAYSGAATTWAVALTFGPPALATAAAVKLATAPLHRMRGHRG